MTRTLSTIAVSATSAILLTGCLSIDADLSVQSDGLVSGELTLEVSEQAAGLLGVTSSEALVEQLQSGQLEGGEATSDLDCVAVERTGALAMTCSFKDQEFSEPEELWWITTDEDSVTFHAKGGEESDTSDEELFGDFLTFGGYTMNVTMPGKITAVTGEFVEQTSDNSIRIDASLSDVFNVTVESEKGSGGLPAWLWIVLGLILLAALAAVTLLFIRRRKTTPPTSEHVEAPLAQDGLPPATP